VGLALPARSAGEAVGVEDPQLNLVALVAQALGHRAGIGQATAA
jgi:hypothetical protein